LLAAGIAAIAVFGVLSGTLAAAVVERVWLSRAAGRIRCTHALPPEEQEEDSSASTAKFG
jgi:hypothetical protein